jgi:hypothetical protein
MTQTRIKTLISTHRLYIGDLQTPVTLQLWRDQETDWLSVSTDRAILTPEQRNGYVAEPSGYHQTPEAALKSVVDGFESCYLHAVEAGHTPEESWLNPTTVIASK